MSNKQADYLSSVGGFSPSARFLPVLIGLGAILAAAVTGCGERPMEDDVVSYVSELVRGDFLRRVTAAEELSRVVDENDVVAVPYLIEALAEPREMYQRYSARALGRIGCYSAIPALIRATRDESDYVRYDAALALGGMDDRRVHRALIEALRDESSYVRWAAAESLGALRAEEAYPRLVSGLRDSSSFVRSASANALGRIGDEAAIPDLRSSLFDRNLWVRNAAARALALLGDNAGIPVLIRNLESTARERDQMVRAQAAEFLREVTGEDFGFDPHGTDAERREAIRRWESWWQERR